MRARLVPLVALCALTSVAVVARVRTRRAVPPVVTSSVAAAKGASEVAGLGAPGDLTREVLRDARVEDGPPHMLHGDVRHTHRAHGQGPRGVKVAWRVATAGPVEAQVVASPDGQTLYVASLGGTLTALGRDGTTRWTVALGDRVYATPCVAPDGTIYVGTDAKRFVAVAPDGRVRWSLETEGDADTGAARTPAGLVVFAAGPIVYGVRPGGDVAFRFRAKGKVFTAPAVLDDGTVVVGAQDHHVYALGPRGELAWSADLGADVDGAPAIGDDGGIFVGTDAGDVVRLDARGTVVWRTPLGGFVRGTLSIARNGDVLAGVFGPTPRMARIDGARGQVRGVLSVPGTGAREFGVVGGALEDDDGTLYFGAQDDDVYAVDARGALLFRYSTRGDVDAPVTLLPTGELIVASDDGAVTLLAPTGGPAGAVGGDR